MKQYLIDQLRPLDYQAVKAYLDDRFSASAVDGIYWIPLQQDLLTEVQAEHAQCHPFYFVVDLEERFMACELLIRTQNRMHCSCMGYATEAQRNWIIGFADAILDKLNIKI